MDSGQDGAVLNVPDDRTETPPQIAETLPSARHSMADYSFTLQAIMELQKTVGGLAEAVNNLKSNIDKQGDKLEKISQRVYAAGVVLTIAVPILAVLANWLGPIILAAIRNAPSK